MNTSQRWTALSARIEGFVEGVRMWGSFSDALANGSQGKQLYSLGHSIFRTLEAEASDVTSSVPPGLLSSDVAQRLKVVLSLPEPSTASVQGFVGEAAVLFQSLITEAKYLLSDNDAVLRTLSERAFLHLQWMIAADPRTRSTWQVAYKAGEVESEKLGAAHLLWHGIYPFKVSNRVATDLVLNEPMVADHLGVAQGAVLTEWKVVRSDDNLSHKIESAEIQAEEYSSGVLGGTELRSIRYIVLVSERKLAPEPDRLRGSHIYRHVNIAVDPESPSKSAPKQAIAERAAVTPPL